MSRKMRIAVMGGGFAGLALSYHLLAKEKGLFVALFDAQKGASFIASGLLHPFPGEKARLSWEGIGAMAASRHLLDLAQEALGKRVYEQTGIIRIALKREQEIEFKKKIGEFSDIEWWERGRLQQVVPVAIEAPALFIRSGLTVYSALYLQGLLELSRSLGLAFIKKEVTIEELDQFDQVVLATGGAMRRYKRWEHLPLRYNKGQVLLFQKPASLLSLQHSVIGRGYVALSEEIQRGYVGSTYEHHFTTELPDEERAKKLIFSQVGHFLQDPACLRIERCLAGVRVTHQKSYHPVVGRLERRIWIITGMGSRGLLYHGYLSEKLAEAILSDRPDALPKEVAIER